MAIKRIEWTVAEDCQSLSPAGVQDAGVQGEDKATVAVFKLPESLQAGYDLYLEYIDTYDGYDISDKLAVEDGAVAYALPLAWTQHGGRATLRLVAAVPGEEDDQEMVAYTLHAQISYHKRPGVWGRVKSMVQETVERLALLCQQWAASARASATKAEESETIAGTAAATAGQAASGADASAKAAAQAAQTAADEAAAAESSRAGAATSATMAEQSMLEAANHKLAAESSEYNARLSMEAANASAFSAAQSEQAAAESAEKAETRVESVLERNDRVPLSFWVGTQAEYDALAEKPNNCFCIVTDDVIRGTARNLLDNSDFTDPVNQRGIANTETWKYCLDRWVSRLGGMAIDTASDGTTITAADATGNNFIYQKVANYERLLGKTVTAAAVINGELCVCTCTLPSSLPATWTSFATDVKNGCSVGLISTNGSNLCVNVGLDGSVVSSCKIEWAALYEGEYTAETLPEYRPRGYGAELAECQRYYVRTRCGAGFVVGAEDTVFFDVPLPVTMRIKPTLESSTIDDIRTAAVYLASSTVSKVAVRDMTYTNIPVACMMLSGTFTGAKDHPAFVNGWIELSADL